MGRNKGGHGRVVEVLEDLFTLDPQTAAVTSLLLFAILIIVRSVVALCRRRKTIQRNKECWRLMQRVEWLRQLLEMLRSAPPQMDQGAAATATRDLRAALASRLRTTVMEADKLAGSLAMNCCLCGFARCDATARKLKRNKAGVDEIYLQVLPVVSRVDDTQRVVQMMGALPHKTTSSSQNGGDNGSPFANSHSMSIQLAG